MFRRAISWTLVITILALPYGCSHMEVAHMSPDEIEKTPEIRIDEVVLASGDHIVLIEPGGTYSATTRTIEGNTIQGKVSIDIGDVLYVHATRRVADKGATIAVLLLVAAVLAIFIGIASSDSGTSSSSSSGTTSCPLFFSFDGDQYVFDSEPLGGAISEGLARRDWGRLEHLQPVDGNYRLMMLNQEGETQHLDEVKLTVVDHPRGTFVAPDLGGRMHALRQLVPPTRVYNEKGEDISTFFEARDEVAWQTHLPRDDSYRGGPHRHALTFEFPKPPGATSARLVAKAGTAPWGSHMIKEMLELRGDGLETWYKGIDSRGREFSELYAFMQREELFTLDVNIQTGGAWERQGFIPAGGPLVTEDHVIPLDLTSVVGDQVIVRLNPPLGYWSIDYVGLDFDNEKPVNATTVTATQALDSDAKDWTETFAARDGNMHVMTGSGDAVTFLFEPPPALANTERTVFVSAFGYYRIHTPQAIPEQTELIRKLTANEGAIVEYSLDKYLELWTQVTRAD